MNITTTSTTNSNNNNNSNGISGNGNIGASAAFNASVRPPPPTSSSSSSSSSNNNNNSSSSSKPHHSHSHHHHHHHQQQHSHHKKESIPAQQPQQNIIKDPINSKISEFSCKLKFQNSLPEIPFEPKFLKIQSDFSRFTKYKTTSLERAYKHPLLTEPHLGIPIELIDPSSYNTPKVPLKVPENDEPLLKPLSQQDLEEKHTTAIFKKKSEIRPNVGWLRKTEYLSKSDENTFGRVKRSSTPGDLTPNSGKQLQLTSEQLSDSILVENTFDICSSDFQFIHPTNPSLKPTSVLSVFPDFELWANSFTEVTFDADPLDHFLPKDLRDDKVSEYTSRHDQIRNKAIVKGITDKFVYFITPDPDNNKNNNDDDDEDFFGGGGDSERPYKMQKVLNSDIVTGDANSNNYFFIVRDDAVYYNPLKNRVNLKKIKSKDDKTLVRTRIGRPSSITYTTRQQNSKELRDKESIISDLLQEDKAPFSNKKLKRSNKLSDDEDNE